MRKMKIAALTAFKLRVFGALSGCSYAGLAPNDTETARSG
jgi:hypothetical protein